MTTVTLQVHHQVGLASVVIVIMVVVVLTVAVVAIK
jgi:hypothetical protein